MSLNGVTVRRARVDRGGRGLISLLLFLSQGSWRSSCSQKNLWSLKIQLKCDVQTSLPMLRGYTHLSRHHLLVAFDDFNPSSLLLLSITVCMHATGSLWKNSKNHFVHYSVKTQGWLDTKRLIVYEQWSTVISFPSTFSSTTRRSRWVSV